MHYVGHYRICSLKPVNIVKHFVCSVVVYGNLSQNLITDLSSMNTKNPVHKMN
jgi:hypothetical protein